MHLSALLQLSLVTSALGGVVKLSTEKKPITARDLTHKDVVKRFDAGQPLQRRATILEQLYNDRQKGGYFINITVGTPPQPLSVILDTGSSDLWVLSPDSDLCQSPRLQERLNEKCYGGQYDRTKSSTYKQAIEGGFEIKYVDESGSAGDYIFDDVGLSDDNTIKSLQMGLGLKSSIGVGIMGIGYTENEAAEVPYPNIIDEMVNQGLINTRAYSLYLDTRDATHGSILFGGLDTKKFIGQLATLPLAKRRGSGVDSFTVAMTGLSIGPKGDLESLTTSEFAIAALLDSGTTLTYLPDALVAVLVKKFGAYADVEDSGSIWLDCSIVTNYPDYVLAYQFGGPKGPTINVPLKEVIFDIPASYQKYFNLPWKETCYLGILPSGQDTHYLLGDSFLRSAYVVYDIDNDELSIANTNFEAVEENIVEITSGGSIPSATGVKSQVTVTADDEIGGPDGGERTSISGTIRPSATDGLGGGLSGNSQITDPTANGNVDGDGDEGAASSLLAGGMVGLLGVWTVGAVVGGGLLFW